MLFFQIVQDSLNLVNATGQCQMSHENPPKMGQLAMTRGHLALTEGQVA